MGLVVYAWFLELKNNDVFFFLSLFCGGIYWLDIANDAIEVWWETIEMQPTTLLYLKLMTYLKERCYNNDGEEKKKIIGESQSSIGWDFHKRGRLKLAKLILHSVTRNIQLIKFHAQSK